MKTQSITTQSNPQNLKIVDPVQITINNSYNLGRWEEAIIRKCVADNPSFTQIELAAALGMSERCLVRKALAMNLDITPNKMKSLPDWMTGKIKKSKTKN